MEGSLISWFSNKILFDVKSKKVNNCMQVKFKPAFKKLNSGYGIYSEDKQKRVEALSMDKLVKPEAHRSLADG